MRHTKNVLSKELVLLDSKINENFEEVAKSMKAELKEEILKEL